MASPQTLTDPERRRVAVWAADCAERALPLFETEAPADRRVGDAIARARSYGRGEVTAAEMIRRRFEAGRAANTVRSPQAVAAVRAAAQASGVAHMGAHALGAAAYAAHAIGLASLDPAGATQQEIAWQLGHMTPQVRSALRLLPALGTNSAGPLGTGLLTRGALAAIITRLQEGIVGGTGA